MKWLSPSAAYAARWKTCVMRCSAKSRERSAASSTVPWTKTVPFGTLSVNPPLRSSRPTTSWPRCISRSAMCDPMNPAAPVTRMAIASAAGPSRTEQRELHLPVRALAHVGERRRAAKPAQRLPERGHRQAADHHEIVERRRSRGMMFADVREVAAEVHEGLVLHERPRGCADVHHRRAGPEADLPAGGSRPAAPVDVLVINEKPFVERSDRVEARPPHQKKAADDPVDVLLDIAADPRSILGAQLEAKQVPDFAPGSRKPERRRLFGALGVRIAVQDAQGADLRVRVHVADGRRQRTFVLDRVAFEQ